MVVAEAFVTGSYTAAFSTVQGYAVAEHWIILPVGRPVYARRARTAAVIFGRILDGAYYLIVSICGG